MIVCGVCLDYNIFLSYFIVIGDVSRLFRESARERHIRRHLLIAAMFYA